MGAKKGKGTVEARTKGVGKEGKEEERGMGAS
jgi:hypothetical protein